MHRVAEVTVVSQMSRICLVVSCLRVTNISRACPVVSGRRFWHVNPVRRVTDVTCLIVVQKVVPIHRVINVTCLFCHFCPSLHGCHPSSIWFLSCETRMCRSLLRYECHFCHGYHASIENFRSACHDPGHLVMNV